MRTKEAIKWMTDVVQSAFLARRLRTLSELRTELEANSFLTPDERAAIKTRAASIAAGIAAERAWSPSDKVVAELEGLERDAEAYGQAMYANNLHQIRDLASSSLKGEYKPSDDEALRKRSTIAAEKLLRLAEKHRVPLNGLADLRRWNLLDANGHYVGGICGK